MRTAGCSRAKQLPEVIYSLGTRVRGRPGDLRLAWCSNYLSEAPTLDTRGAGRLCLPSARAHCPKLRAETGHAVLIHCTHLWHMHRREEQ